MCDNLASVGVDHFRLLVIQYWDSSYDLFPTHPQPNHGHTGYMRTGLNGKHPVKTAGPWLLVDM